MTRTAVAYVRVSTAEQRLGPDAQMRELREHAAANDIEIVAWYTEHVSGAAPRAKRLALNAALAHVGEAGADILLAVKRDRIARDLMTMLTVQHELEQLGAVLLTTAEPYVTATPEGKFIATMLDAFAEFERACISSRTKSALAVKRARGEPLGGTKVTTTDAQRGAIIKMRADGRSIKLISASLGLSESVVKTAIRNAET
jgi:DNA invertase Pin-like site-specific DNA recombinase